MIKKQIIAGLQVFLLVSFSFAVAFLISEEVGVGSAAPPAGMDAIYRSMSPSTGISSAVPANNVIPGYIITDVKLNILRGGESVLAERGMYAYPGFDGQLVVGQGGDITGAIGSDGAAYTAGLGEGGTWGLNPVKEGAGLVGTGGGNVGAGTAPAGLKGILSGTTFGTGGGAGIASALFSGLAWGAIIGVAAYGLAKMFGQNEQQAKSIGLGGAIGGFAGTTSYFLAQQGVLGTALQGSAGLFGIAAGVIPAIVIIVLTYKKTKKELVHFECYPWEAPTGGSNCEKCNENPLMPCSEYRCRSLGQGCELINQGTEEERCVWVTKGDTAAPHIEPWAEALSPEGLKYIPDSGISPPNRGFKIVDNEGNECLKALTVLEFGVIADEPAQCKIDYAPKSSYSEMESFFGNSNLFVEKHSWKMKVPSPFTEEGENVPEIGTGGTFTFWVRCIDSNENGEESAMVVFRYCVDDGPDLEAPKVEGTSIQTGRPVRFDADNVSIEVYVNEPAECKWSRQDKAFDAMENEMDCSSETYQLNADLNYVCSGKLTGIKDQEENWFYFRCKDHSTAPGGRNVMTTSYPLLLEGTEPLVINSVGPEEEFIGSTSIVPVTLTAETAHGADEGSAVCSFTTTPENFDSFVAMDNTGSYMHNQSLDLAGGNYIYYFSCIDAANNRAEANTTFSVVVDTTLPKVTRVFRDADVLKVITDEDAKCYYSLTNCDYNLEDGLALTYENPTERSVHVIPWDEAVTYFIKCEDFMGNQPRPDQCHIV
ncbi:MAG: hypothetical protein KJ858_01655, partial [Nanoarchaeota archaeon]|nr:hypothetical protein [Nanoarchaeota archaeon]